MTFLHPWYLIFLVIPLAAIVWVWRREGQRIALPHDFHEPKQLRVWPVAIQLAECLPALAVMVAIILLATPLRSGPPESKRKLKNIQVLLDCSGSMYMYYEQALQAFNSFVDARPSDAFGLSFFGSYCLHWTPITEDVSAVKCAAPFMDPRVTPPLFFGTRIGISLLSTRDQFRLRGEGDRVVILISDGVSMDDYEGGMNRQVAEEMKAAGITVYLISIGGAGINADTAELCHMTGGAAFLADDGGSLKDCFKRIDLMQKIEIQNVLPENKDDFFGVAVAGLSVAVLGLLAAFGARYTPW